MQSLQNNLPDLFFCWCSVLRALLTSMPGFSDSHLPSCSDKPTSTLPGAVRRAALCQKGQAARRASGGRTHAQLSLRHSPLLGAEETFGKAVWLLCPLAWTKLSFCPGAESASSSFAENVLPCEISCPRHAVGTGSLWVRAAAWAPLCLAHLRSVRGFGAQLMLPSQRDSRIGTSWGSDGFSGSLCLITPFLVPSALSRQGISGHRPLSVALPLASG